LCHYPRAEDGPLALRSLFPSCAQWNSIIWKQAAAGIAAGGRFDLLAAENTALILNTMNDEFEIGLVLLPSIYQEHSCFKRKNEHLAQMALVYNSRWIFV
jgi:hypothetical protein